MMSILLLLSALRPAPLSALLHHPAALPVLILVIAIASAVATYAVLQLRAERTERRRVRLAVGGC